MTKAESDLKAKQDAYLTKKAAKEENTDDGKKLLAEFEKLEKERNELKTKADALNTAKANMEAASWAEEEAEKERAAAEAAEEDKATLS